MRRSILIGLLALPGLALATDYRGGDYGGSDLTLEDGDTITGVFNNVGTLTVEQGSTVKVVAGQAVEINAIYMDIRGVIDAEGTGHDGGAGNPAGTSGVGLDGSGPGAGTGSQQDYPTSSLQGGGGGAGHAGAGGRGGGYYADLGYTYYCCGFGGSTYGSTDAEDFSFELGSGGGGGGCYSLSGEGGDGGAGGGAVKLSAQIINLDGTVTVAGEDGGDHTPTYAAAAGGGSGGTLLVEACVLEGTGSFIASGGDGGDANDASYPYQGGGGGGGGGYIHFFNFADNSSVDFDVSRGDFGEGGTYSYIGDPLPGGVGQFTAFEYANPDFDNDGYDCVTDNCPLVANLDQIDSDGDGPGDACDPCPFPSDPTDSDGDTVCDGVDVCPGFDDLLDTDFDGVADGCDPCPLDALDDSDGDGRCDSDDVCPGFDDFGVDTDGDAITDPCDNCIEVANTTQNDTDADTFGDACDCSPFDAAQFPGADEYCNDEDDNCNGLLDENAVDPTQWYLDADGDGQGNIDQLYESCDPPGGAYVLNADDCNDATADAFVGGVEECDSIDNDCDGVVDNGLTCEVDEDPVIPEEPTGCSTTGTGLPAALLLLLPLLARRREQ